MKPLIWFSGPLFLSTLILCATSGPAEAQFVVADDAGATSIGFDDGEITPDGHYGVLRQTGYPSSLVRIHDMATGAKLLELPSVSFDIAGVCEDAVAVTNTRAAVIGSSLQILDLTQLGGTPLMAEYALGYWPRDLAITPDESLLVVRGGRTWGGANGGLFIFELATGTQVAWAPGEPPTYPSTRHSFDVDSVAVTDEHAVCTSVVYVGETPYTRVTVWDLHPAGGGAPPQVFETDAASRTDQLGGPHDLAITPDGTHCAVRSELGMACYALNHGASTQRWYQRLWQNPGPFGDQALDSVEVTDDRIATISWITNPALGAGTQVDLFDIAGGQKYDRIHGDPHDLAIDETGTRLVVRTHDGVFLYDLAGWPAGRKITALDSVSPATGTAASWLAGMDSVALNGTRAVTLFAVGMQTRVFLHDFAGGTLDEIGNHTMDDRPVDLAIAPSGTFCAVTGLSTVDVVDMHTGLAPLTHQLLPEGSWVWSDGVAINDTHALAFGVGDPYSTGWLSIIDLFSAPVNYCTSSPNSVGPGAHLYATGSASVSANDLGLWAVGAPPAEFSLFFYGTQTDSVPFGDGTLCVGGSSYYYLPNRIGAGGIASRMVDYTTPPASGGAIQPGSTWRFQFLYRDLAAGGAGFNLSEGLEIVFGG